VIGEQLRRQTCDVRKCPRDLVRCTGMTAVGTVMDPFSCGIDDSMFFDRPDAVGGTICNAFEVEVELCCSVERDRELNLRVDRSIELTHWANSHTNRPVVSGKTEAESSVRITRPAWS
jgi:hypothetical protein